MSELKFYLEEEKKNLSKKWKLLSFLEANSRRDPAEKNDFQTIEKSNTFYSIKRLRDVFSKS